MLISRAWIYELLSAPPTDMTDEAFGELLTDLGLEVDQMTRVGAGLDSIVVGRIDGVQPHPNADKLRVVELFDGHQTITVVCGAPNVPAAGGKVAFAPVGTRLPGGLEIGARTVRGVESQGMICSEVELDLGTDSAGIIVLPSSWEPGRKLSDLVPGVIDALFELGVTPNRPDALGHVGIARDLAVKLECDLRLPAAQLPQALVDPTLVELRATARCGRYLGFACEGAKVGPSPLWMRVRLHRLGLRAINNVVDITNYVLMETGQPLHAFDRDRLGGGRVVVRLASQAETIRMLDGREVELSADDLVIADERNAQAVAGVIGGEHSGVEASTTRLLLETAWFAPEFVRRTARRLQVTTDSSFRFERGVDYAAGLSFACARASTLIAELAGARWVSGCEANGDVPERPAIALRLDRSAKLLGMEIPAEQAQRILEKLGIEVTVVEPRVWSCTPPTHRPDLQREVDLVEELVRQYGFDRLPAQPSVPSTQAATLPVTALARQRRAQVDAVIVDCVRQSGLHEHLSFVFVGETSIELFGEVSIERAVRLANPMRAQAPFLRTHMLPGLLDALVLNTARHNRAVRLFEYGRVYSWPDAPLAHDPATASVDAALPSERGRVAILVGGGSPADAREVGSTLLGALRRLGHEGRVDAIDGDSCWASFLHPGVRGAVHCQGADIERCVGCFGEVHPDLLEAWNAVDCGRVFYGELWLDEVPSPQVVTYERVPRFPATSRDLSLEIPVQLPAAAVVDALERAASTVEGSENEADPPRLCPGDEGTKAVQLLEDYRGHGVEAGRRALLLRLHYRAGGRSVTDTEVQPLHETVVTIACERLRARGAHVRIR